MWRYSWNLHVCMVVGYCSKVFIQYYRVEWFLKFEMNSEISLFNVVFSFASEHFSTFTLLSARLWILRPSLWLSPLSSLLSRLSLSLISLASMSRWLFIANLPIVSWLSIYLHIFLTICPSTSLPINLCTDEISISDVNRHKTSLAIIYMCLEVYCYECIC